MWYCVLCVFTIVLVPGCVYGNIESETAEMVRLCCGQGTKYARSHSSEDCSSSIPPPEVSPSYGSLCIITMDHCCNNYFQKKLDCETGVELAAANRCDSTNTSTKSCCAECVRGTADGTARGEAVCISDDTGKSTEELLAADAYVDCCKKAASKKQAESANETRGKPATRSKRPISSVLPSMCEEFAPNELCAHHCIPVPGSYRCECNPGFKLMADRRNCIEVTENRCKQNNPCQHKCNDNGVEVKCSCRRGYELMADGKSCQDIDECMLEPPVCLPNTQCHNLQGSYRCVPKKNHNNAEKGKCPPGFARNTVNNACDDIDECSLASPPCPSYVCENTIGGYKCGGVMGDPGSLPSTMKPPAEDRCPTGFRAGYDEECEDVDECSMKKDDCNPLSQFCINTLGSFHCQDKGSKHCPPGFKIDPMTNKCEDIDECEDGEDICRPDQICVNQPGQYDCKPKNAFSKHPDCPDGMRLKQGTSTCEDIDECVEGIHMCDPYQNCLNTNGSHECHCKEGFELDPITRACADINECATNRHDCIHTQRCDNTVGSFLCIRFTSCGTGYILHHSTGKCEDVDECALGTHNCAYAGPEYICVNIPGSFRCIRNKTTTPAPEYEYYYDSEEDLTLENETSSQSTTTTKKPEPSTEVPQTAPNTIPPSTSQPVDIKPFEDSTDDANNEVIPPSPTPPPVNPVYESVYESIKPEQPVETPVQPDASIPTEPVPEIPEAPKQPDNKESEPTFTPDTYYEVLPTKPVTTEQNESVHPEPNLPPPAQSPDVSYIPVSSSEMPVLSGPSVVYVNVGKETATVQGETREDGSVVVDTKDVPKNEWTKIDAKPTNCQPGFILDEYGACYDIDECATGQHTCSGLTENCKNTMGGYICECAPGFRRDLYTAACEYITTSSTTTSTSTSTTTTTTLPPTTSPRQYFWGYPEYRPVQVRPFRPRTWCDDGFHRNSQTGVCEDVNECTNGQANCAAVEICVNTEGGYRCECPPNWYLDDIKHKCLPNKSNDQFPSGYGNQPTYRPVDTLLPDISSRGLNSLEPELKPVDDRRTIYSCPWGYRLSDDGNCEDIDECANGEAKCGPIQICTNIAGGYSCNCPPGHRLIGDHECEDVDECAQAGSVPICSQNADCINTVGSYQCLCHAGFRSAPINDKVCVDVDECTESHAGTLCEHSCSNVWGSYRCMCHRGYRLNSDNSTCSDIDECTQFKTKIPCVGKCINMPGSYRCACPSGYKLSEDKRSCIDIDECETGEATCAGSSWNGGRTYDFCLNTRGGYKCRKITCPPGYRLVSKNRCSREERECPPADWNCAHQPTTLSHNFITFVSNLYIPESKGVDLFTMRGPTWPFAQNRFRLRLMEVNAPPSVKVKADINSFLLSQKGYQGVVSLQQSLEGPQSIELELIMELYQRDQFAGIAVAKIFIFVSEYEF